MSHTRRPVRWDGATLGGNRRVCIFCHARDEEYRTLRPFIEEGFALALAEKVAQEAERRRFPLTRWVVPPNELLRELAERPGK